ncbi:twin-arginine translocase subunit TatB [Martelella alba]|uniref:Sec-independent protein translocase protein TatB n=1 Tax=Martelella alba TaxID=2590451 RepID=A0A506UJN1_9HYPH|nr:Sec-independent protein translocase protein TatB [Martelella alba]TPW33502.1 twin-arginine translocase subunit TatB [Martelella alba]
MLDIGWLELLVIAIVLIVVVGPRELPHVLRTFGKTMTQFRKVATDFRSQMDQALKEADLDEVASAVNDVRKLNPANSIRDAVNPLRQTANDIKADLKKSTALDNPPAEKAGSVSLPKTSYPTPGSKPDLSPGDIFQKTAQKKAPVPEPARVSAPVDSGLTSIRSGHRPAPRPVKSHVVKKSHAPARPLKGGTGAKKDDR